ncbi:NF038129 family PEP-CTERM protein [Methylomonas koyamae]|uniref:NF038129 family PEP-CTERM protein n=1 Tax=Methylomonas koyamae TaxID=702114 RepID=UPI00112B2F22|nr:NF038129 family PEP-CTERM protein [Methylomonas koyamae]
MRQLSLIIRQVLLIVTCTVLFISSPVHAASTTYSATVNTSLFANTDALIAFDLIPGDSPTLNTVIIFDFLTDGSISSGTAMLSGDATGDLTSNAFLQNTSFFNEIIQPISLGNSITFYLTVTQEFSGSIPDALSLFLLDKSYMPLFNTSDPTGADSLFLLNIDGTSTGNLSVYAANPNTINQVTWSIQQINPNTNTVSEPPILWLVVIGIFIIYIINIKYKKLIFD